MIFNIRNRLICFIIYICTFNKSLEKEYVLVHPHTHRGNPWENLVLVISVIHHMNLWRITSFNSQTEYQKQDMNLCGLPCSKNDICDTQSMVCYPYKE